MPPISLYTSAWFDDKETIFDLPDHCAVDVFHPLDALPLNDNSILEKLNSPYGESLDKLAHGKKAVTIVVDDLGRPTPAHLVIPHVLKILKEHRIKDNCIRFLIATGSHRQLTDVELEKKLGVAVLRKYEVICHDAFNSPMKHLGFLPHKFPCIVNKTAYDSDLLIGIGSVLPHSCHGFGGGAKLFLPGIAGIESISFMHGFSKKRGRGNSEPSADWDMRIASELFCDKLCPIFSINTVVNSRRQICGLFAGNFRASHHASTNFAKTIYETPIEINNNSYDIVVVNSYPLDSDPVQSDKSQWVRDIFPNALFIFLNDAHDGLDYHGWKRLHKSSMLRRNFIKIFRNIERSANIPRLIYFLLNRGPVRLLKEWILRTLFISKKFDYGHYLSENISAADHASIQSFSVMNEREQPWVYSKHYPASEFRKKYKRGTLINDWNNIIEYIHKTYPKGKIAVFTCAPLQLPKIINTQG